MEGNKNEEMLCFLSMELYTRIEPLQFKEIFQLPRNYWRMAATCILSAVKGKITIVYYLRSIDAI